MYLGIDIGGTKTLVATLDDSGVIQERCRFPTPKDFEDFTTTLATTVASLTTSEFVACGVGFPGRLDREHGMGIAAGNLPWRNIDLRSTVKKIAHCPVVVENDAKLAALSEAMLLKKEYNRVLYVTISTGIGIGLVADQSIEPALEDAEGGLMLLEHKGKLQKWETFASGHAIKRRFGKLASQITDEPTWRIIAKDIAVGLIDLITVLQPEVIVLGGGVATYYDRFKKPLTEILHTYETPLVPIPPIRQAARPEDAVVYGCYDLAKSRYGSAHS